MSLKQPRFWLAALLMLFWAQSGQAQLLVNKSFSPANIAPAGTTTLTIDIANNTATAATGVSLTDSLPTSPAGLRIGSGGLLSNSCGGSVSAPVNGTTVTLTGGNVPAAVSGVAGRCSITVQLIASPTPPPATYVNTIPTTNVNSSIGASSSPASATLSVMGVQNVTGTKTWSASVMHGNGPSVRTTIRLNNPNSYPLTNLAFTDTFPTTMFLAPVPNVANTCGGTVTAVGSGLSLALSGGTIAANSFCTVQADLVARNPLTSPANSSSTNRLSANSVSTAQGATNASNINGAITVQKGAQVIKSFSPTGVQPGQSSTLTLVLKNFNSSPITGFAFTDAMPSGVTVNGPVASTCGGTASFTATAVSVTGGSLGSAPATAGSADCTITVPVSAATSGNYVNSVPAGTLAGTSFSTASATLQVSAVSGSKAFSFTSVPQTGVTMLTITLSNRNTTTPATITSFADNLSTMGAGISIATTPASTTTCGGTLTAVAGTTAISLAGGTIPRASSATVAGSCTITVPVQVSNIAATGTRTNTVAAGALVTSLGNNPAGFTAAISVVAPLTLSKTNSPSNVVGGTVTRVTVTLSRTAQAALLTSVSMTDPLPGGFTVAPSPAAATTCSSGTVTAVPGATSFSLSNANLGTAITSSSSCTVSVNVLAPATNGSYTNTIPIGSATASSAKGPVSNLTAASRAILVISGVTLNKDFAPTAIIPGGVSRLRVYISNPLSAGISLTGVALTDNFPSGLVLASPANLSFTATSGSCIGTPSGAPGASSFSISGASIASGASCELAADVTTASVGSLTNALLPGALTSAQGQSNSNTATATLVSSGSADVSVTKSDSTGDFVAGATNTYAMVITNNSTALSVAGLPVSDLEPAGLTFTSWACLASPGSSCTDATGSGPIASSVTLAPLGNATFTADAVLDPGFAGSTITNIITVDPAAAGVVDPVSINNTASDTNNVVRRADVKLTKTVSNPSPRIGDTITFTLQVENLGPSDAATVSVTDVLPSGYSFISATPSIGSWSAPTWTVGTLESGATATLALVTEVLPSGNYANSASATTATTDPESANNTSSVTPGTVGLSILKVSTILSDPINGAGAGAKAIPGAVVEYRITLLNAGTSAIDADTIVLEDVLPTQLALYVSTMSGAPISMNDGPPPSGLTFTFPTHVQFSSTPGGGAPYSYTPSPDGTGHDAAITSIRLAPAGSMAAGTLSAPTQVEFVYRGRVQ